MDTATTNTGIPRSRPPLNYAALFVVIVIVCTYFGYIYGRSIQTSKTSVVEIAPVVINYTKREFKETPPPTFLDTIPLPSGVSFQQSYELSYASSSTKQATVVFSSPKNVIENYALYEAFLEKNEWWLPTYNKRAGMELSSLYANKYDEEAGLIYTNNIAISKSTTPQVGTSTSSTGSEVSISVGERRKE